MTCCAELYEQAIKYEKGSFITETGALATLSGAKTGRSPRDKRVVRDETTEDDLWWGKYVVLAHHPLLVYNFICMSLFFLSILTTTINILLLFMIGAHQTLKWTSTHSW